MKPVVISLAVAVISTFAVTLLCLWMLTGAVAQLSLDRPGPNFLSSPTPASGSPQPVPTGAPANNPGIMPAASLTPPSGSSSVSFDIAITGVTGTELLTKTVSARIINTSGRDVHNAWIKVELFSQDQRVALNGLEYLRVDIGTLKAGEAALKQATITVGLFDGLKISQNGSRFALTIFSDEGTQTINYDYRP